MSDDARPAASGRSRRDFLTGRAIRAELEETGEKIADALVKQDSVGPRSAETIRLSTTAMATEFSIIQNPGPGQRMTITSDALDLVHELEDQMTVYREQSTLMDINRQAYGQPVEVETQLFGLFQLCQKLHEETAGAFDPTSGPLIALWKQCRDKGHIPTEDELCTALQQTGMEHVLLDELQKTVHFERSGLSLNLGGIGKGFALDRIGAFLQKNEMNDYLVHGGRSSIFARGDHNQQGGWPVGIMNPAFRNQRYGTILLRNCGMSTSGSSVQFFRHEGQRYGHILDPRSGWPAAEALSVTVLAPTAAKADALSTAFFVMGLEKTREYCDNHPQVGALIIPPPQGGRSLQPISLGIPDEILFLI